MRLPWLEKVVVMELIKASEGKIEKLNWMTTLLEKLYKNKPLRDNWIKFIDNLISILIDATVEARVARQWTHKGEK